MKKVFVLSLALALALALCAPAFADHTVTQEDTLPIEKETKVSFDVDPTYTITIPAEVKLVKEETEDGIVYKQEATVVASAGVRLLEGQAIQVKLQSESGFQLKTEAAIEYTLPYTVTVDDGETAIESDGVVAEFTTSAEEQTAALHFTADDPTYAGEYTDKVVFNIAIVP